MVQIMALGNGMNVCYGGQPTEDEMKEFVIALDTVSGYCEEKVAQAINELPPQLREMAYAQYQEQLEEQNREMGMLADMINQRIATEI